MFVLDLVFASIWLMLPAFIANPMAAVFGGGTPMDFGKNFMDGKRILGDGKTIRGLVCGTICGLVTGFVQVITAPYLGVSPVFSHWPNFQRALGAYSNGILYVVFLMSLGALMGDSAESFIKRRLNLERGAMFPVADQLDFVLGSWILTFIFAPVWFKTYFSIWILITIVVVTPLLHVTANIFGYLIKVKKEPW